MTRATWLLPCLLVACLLLSLIGAPYPEQMALQHIPTVLALVAWPWLQRGLRLSRTSMGCIAGFLLLHIVGARYIYSYVPYDDWIAAVTGVSLQDLFGFRRNHYDRLVHFSFGLLFTRPIFDCFVSRLDLPRRLAPYFTVECVLAASAVYELFEWSLTLLLAGGDAEAYNGQQGDMWDAHKDMALAAAGSVLAVLWMRRGTTRD